MNIRFLPVLVLLALPFAPCVRPAVAADKPAARSDSSMVGSISYDKAKQILTVVMAKDGATYEYRNVPEKVYKDFTSSKAKGSFYLLKIRGQYESVKK